MPVLPAALTAGSVAKTTLVVLGLGRLQMHSVESLSSPHTIAVAMERVRWSLKRQRPHPGLEETGCSIECDPRVDCSLGHSIEGSEEAAGLFGVLCPLQADFSRDRIA